MESKSIPHTSLSIIRVCISEFSLVWVLSFSMFLFCSLGVLASTSNELEGGKVAGVDVSGNLIDNDTWTLANSPYNIVGDVGVPSDYTLTIEAGVEINYTGDFRILVFGAIQVNGTETDSVRFNGNSVEGTKYMLEVRRTNLDNSKIDYAVFEGPQGAILQGITSDVIRNQGGLRISETQIINSIIQSNPINEDGSEITYSPFIEFTGSQITNSRISGDSFRYMFDQFVFYGGKISNSTLNKINTKLEGVLVTDMGFYGDLSDGIYSLTLVQSTILESNIGELENIFDRKSTPTHLLVDNAKLIDTQIVTDQIEISNSIVINNSPLDSILLDIRSDGSSINNTSFYGNQMGIGVYSNNSSFSLAITNSTFTKFGEGIKVLDGSFTTTSSNYVSNSNFHIENLSGNNIDGISNYWDSDSPTIIATKIYDQNDNLELGLVDISDRLSEPNINAPISPPQSVVKSDDGAGGLDITWVANPEADAAGYKVYWGDFTGYSFENTTDAGNVLTYNIPGLSISDSVAITAYDNLANETDDQVEGHESWFSFSKNVETDFLSFSFQEQTDLAIIDAANHSIEIEIGYTDNPESLMASFTLSSGATAKIEDGDQESGVTSNDFTNPVTYTITAEDNTTTQDWVVTVNIQPNPRPTISDFFPKSGPIGTEVIITGTNFNLTPENNIVYFGAVKAAVTSVSATELIVTTPAGATYEPMTVLNKEIGLMAYSTLPFVVTFDGIDVLEENSFDSAVKFNTGEFPVSPLSGDFDGDGKPDLVVPNFYSNSISLFKNISSGVENIDFAPKMDLLLGGDLHPEEVDIGDLNGDGMLDIVVVSTDGDILSIILNESSRIGDIGFSHITNISVGPEPVSVSIGDLNNDGKPDLVISNRGSSSISILRNTSIEVNSVTFEAHLDYETGSDPRSVTLQDLDGDKFLDISLVNYNSNTLSVFKNTASSFGDISYASRMDYQTGIFPISVSAGDLDGDYMNDLVVVNQSSGTLSIFINNGLNVDVVSFAERKDYSTGLHPFSVSIADMNGDKRTDLVTSNRGESKSISILQNETEAVGEIKFREKNEFFVEGNLDYLLVSDLNNDGKPDIATAEISTGAIYIYRNSIVDSNLSLETNINTFTFPTQTSPPTINTTTHTIGITVSSATDLASLVATFELSAGATAKVGGVIQESGVTANDFTNPVTYTVTAEDGVTTQDWEVTVTKEIEGLIAYYPFNGNANDESGNGNNGAVSGASLAEDRFGNAESAYYFNGTNSQIELPSQQLFQNEGSISGWINKASNTDFVWLFDNDQISISFTDQGQFRMWVVSDQGSVSLNTNEVLDNDKWVFFVCNYDGTTQSIYLDGTLAASSEAGITLTSVIGNSYLGGRSFASNFFEGSIDDVRIYNRALSTDEIISLYQEGGWPDGTNFAPTNITLSSNTINENAIVGTLIGTLSTTDADSDTHSYSIVSGSNNFKIVGLELRTAQVFDYEAKNNYSVTIRSIDSDGLFFDKNFEISILDVNESINQSPQLTGGSITINENVSKGHSILFYSAFDPDGDMLTFSIVSGNDQNTFALNSSTGELTVNDASKMDYEVNTSFELAIRVSDGILSDEETSFINLRNLNESGSLIENERPTEYVLTSGGFLVSVSASDEDGIEEVWIHYKKASQEKYDSSILEANLSSQYTYSMDDSNMDNVGVQYKFVSIDGFGDVTETLPFITYTLTPGDATKVATSGGSGSNIKNYSIIAFPFDEPDVEVLLSELGTYNNKNWRLYGLNSTTQSYHENKNLLEIAPGEGYWFIKRKDIEISMGGRTVDIENEAFKIDLLEGYNLIGNPFQGTLDWTATVQHNIDEGIITIEDVVETNRSELYTWNTAYILKSTLNAFEGGLVGMTRTVGDFEIPLSALSDAGARLSSALPVSEEVWIDGIEWDLDLYFKTPSYDYYLSGIGVRQDASDLADRYDRVPLPHFELYLNVAFDDGFTKSVKASDDFKHWEFTIPNNLKEDYFDMSWDLPVSSNKTVMLIDGASRKMVDFQETSSIRLPNNQSANHHLYFGTKPEIFANLNLPYDVLFDVYPNPATDVINIEIFASDTKSSVLELISIDGRSVYLKNQEFSKGLNKIQLKLNEQAIPNGIYFLKVDDRIMTKLIKQ